MFEHFTVEKVVPLSPDFETSDDMSGSRKENKRITTPSIKYSETSKLYSLKLCSNSYRILPRAPALAFVDERNLQSKNWVVLLALTKCHLGKKFEIKFCI